LQTDLVSIFALRVIKALACRQPLRVKAFSLLIKSHGFVAQIVDVLPIKSSGTRVLFTLQLSAGKML